MNYSDIIRRAFRSLKSGGMWGFIASTYGAMALLFIVAFVGGIIVAGGVAGFSALAHAFDSASGGSAAVVRALLAFSGFVVLALIVAIPLGLIAYGGLIHLSDEFAAGRPVTVGDGWRFGSRRMGRVLLVDLAFGILGTALLAIGIVPLVLGVLASSRGGSSPGPAIVLGVCGGGLLILLLVVVLAVLGALESLSIRYALIGDRTAGDAIAAGWAALKARFGSVISIVLILFGFGVVAGLVESAINGIVQFMTIGMSGFSAAGQSSSTGSAAITGAAVSAGVIVYVISFGLQLVLRIVQTTTWTVFFRQMTGLDPASAATPGYAYPSYPPAPGSGFSSPLAPSYPPAEPHSPTAPQPVAPRPPAEPGEWTAPPMAGPDA